jgi:penicillin amidase
MRRLRLVAAGLLMLLITVVVGVFLFLGTARPQLEGTVRLGGLSHSVEVWRDSAGVPHIWADTPEDLLFAQGFVHAQDRLWQMELFRRVAEGRLAEALGEDLVPSDRFLRTVGLWRAAGEQEAAAPPELLHEMRAYAAGVNAFLEQRRGALPPEFIALRIRPEPWTPRHSLAIERIMSWDLGAYALEAAVTRAAKKLGEERARALVPFYPAWGPTILEVPVPPALPERAAALIASASITHASNAWVLGGQRTRSGKPILANDMHLALRAPAIWYLAALHTGAVDVTGMTLPGTPWIVAGHNRAIAWGYTNASLDDADLFVERVDPADSTRYLTPAGSEPFRVLHDSIRVKGRTQAVPIDIRLTRHGPILSDLADPRDQGLLALRWAGADLSTTADAIRGFNRATGWSDFVAAVRRFDNPHQNVVYADTAGNFGYVMGGRIPRRGDERGAPRMPPLLPVPGWSGEWDWNGWLPFEAHPSMLNPASGYVVTANNKQAAGAMADRISAYWEQPYRAARIRQMILEATAVDADTVHRMQLDVRDALAERYRDLAVNTAERAGLAEEAGALASWDLRAARSSHGAALFYAWYEAIAVRLRTALWGDSTGMVPRSALDAVLDRQAVLWGDTSRAAFDSLAIQAMRAAQQTSGERTWGQLHSVYSEHALAAAAVLERLLRLNVGPLPGDGSPTTVNVSDYAAGHLPVRADYGPSQRHVVDMADIDGSGGFILPTGQSGLPFSRHYRDQARRWREGGLWRIPLAQEAARARTVHRLLLQPAR